MCSRRRKKNGGQTEQALGRSRGGFSTKIHIGVDALGNPLRLRLTGGQAHDVTEADKLIEGLIFGWMIADRDYDADTFRAKITECGAEAVIPGRSNRRKRDTYDKHLYKERHLLVKISNFEFSPSSPPST